MGNYYITFRSVTAAQRAQRLLEGAGYPAVLLRTPGVLAERGCGYSLRLKRPEGAVALLTGAGLRYGKCYFRGQDGKWEEVTS